jgi:Flp pilus assembly protein TadD
VELCQRCLSAEKADRPGDAGVVAQAVADLRAAAEERARQAELERVRAEGERARAQAEAREQKKRRRVQLALAAALGLLLAGGGAFAWHADRQATQRRLEAEERDRQEQARQQRNAEALAELLGRCEQALRRNDAAGAGAALGQAERRLAEGGGEALRQRAARCGADLALLRALDAIDTFRWTPVQNRFPDGKAVASHWRAALAGYGVRPGQAPAAEAAARLAGSLLRDRLLTALDLWLLAEPSAAVRELLRVADPDPYRQALREAVVARDRARQAELAGRREALAQPARFAAALGQNRAVAAERRRVALEAALRPRPGDLALLMALGQTYPVPRREGSAERARWYQAAVAAHPRSVAAHNNLGSALRAKGDLDGAIACFKEAIRLNPKHAPAHNNLGIALGAKGDRAGAIACFKEAVRLSPKAAYARTNLGIALRNKGDLDGAVACFKEAIWLNPKFPGAHNNLGIALGAKGDLNGAVASFKQALRLDPMHALARANLRRTELMRQALPRLADVLAGRAQPKTPAEGCTLASLCALPFQQRYAAAARLYAQAFAADPRLADDLGAAHRYNAACAAARAARGDGYAPASATERAALRARTLAWLRADLALRKKQAADPAQRRTAAAALVRWLADPDLAGVRPGRDWSALPAGERAEWDAFWAEVRATRAAAGKLPPPATLRVGRGRQSKGE